MTTYILIALGTFMAAIGYSLLVDPDQPQEPEPVTLQGTIVIHDEPQETFIIRCRPDQMADAYAVMRRWVDNPELNFTCTDGLVMADGLAQLVEAHEWGEERANLIQREK